MRTEPSTPFSSGTEYENFIYYFCERCKRGKRNEDGFPEFPEEGGCPIWDAMENARFGQPFPSDKIVRLVGDNGEIQVYNCCMEFDAVDADDAEAYKALFEDCDPISMETRVAANGDVELPEEVAQ